MTYPQFNVPTEALNQLFNGLACRWVCIVGYQNYYAIN